MQISRVAVLPALLVLAAGSCVIAKPAAPAPAAPAAPVAPAAPAAPAAPIAPAAPLAPSAPVTPKVAIAKTPEGVAAANAALGRATELYRGYKSYSDTLRVNSEIRVKTPDGENPQVMEDAIKLNYGGAERFALTNAEAGFYAKGKTKTAHLVSQNRYVQVDGSDWANVAGPLESILNIHPVASLLLGRVGGERPFPLIDEVLGSAKDKLDGKDVLLVGGKARVPFGFGDEPVDVTLAFDSGTGALVRVEFDMLESMKAMFAAQMAQMPAELREKLNVQPLKALMTLSITEAKKDPAIDDAAVTFVPGKSDKKVDTILGGEEEPASTATPEALVGKPVPAFKAPLLAGGDLDIASLRGKVVVLDFWATWCPPCVKAIPHIQKMHEELESKGVVFLGMNQDKGQKDKVQKYIDTNKVSFRQVMDMESTIARDFNIEGIPTLFILDKEGVIRYAHTGFADGQEKEIREKLEAVLAGKSLEAPKAAEAPAKVETKPVDPKAETKPDAKPEPKTEAKPEKK